jgi:cellulose synthase (UDP-forming)
LTLVQWLEYFLRGVIYFTGFATFLLMLSPVAFLLFDIHPISMNDRFSYLYIYLPYLIYHIQTIVTLKTRGVKASGSFWGLNLIFLTFPTYMKAVFYALIGKKLPFVATPKSSGDRTSIKYFLPQIAMMIVMALSIGLGIIQISHQISIPLLINTLWCLYCLAMLQGTWYFMSPLTNQNS